MTPFSHSLLIAAAAAAFALPLSGAAQTTAATDPVGYITLKIDAAPDANTRAMSFRGLGLAQPVAYQGVASAVSINPSTSSTPDSISAVNTGWTADQFNGANGKYYAEILGTPGTAGVGTMYDIAATVVTAGSTTQTITLDQRLASGVAGTPMFRIRKHWTVGDAFGAANDKGLAGGFATTADVISVYTNGSYVQYYYSTATGQVGWRKVNDATTNVAGDVIYPDDGLLITRQDTNVGTATQVVLSGAAKTGQTSFPVVDGLNILTNPYAAPMTLASSNLYTTDPATGLAPGFATTADQVLLYNAGTYDAYYYSTGGSPGVGWRKVNGTTDAKDVQIPVGASFIVRRTNPGAFNWVSPQHPTSF